MAALTVGLVLIGCPIGVAIALPVGRLLEAQLYGIRPTEPTIYIAGAVLLMAISALAGVLPTRQATRVDPMEALRHE